MLDKREDANGFGAWLGHRDNPDAPFILVLAQFLAGKTREAVDAAAATAEAGGFLQSSAVDLPAPIGYVCMVNDPDGNTIEFSHNQGVFDFAEEHMK